MTLSGAARGAVLAALAVVLTLDASVQEFAELVALPDDARRERFHLPAACTPIISAVKAAGPSASRLTVVVDCSPPPGVVPRIKPASWGDKFDHDRAP